MRILHVISSAGFYGAENVVYQLALEQGRRKECQPVVAVIENRDTPHRELAEECSARGIETIILPCRGQVDWATAGGLKRVLREQRIDIIHSHGYKANIYSRVAASGWNGRSVATCHNWPGRSRRMKFYALLDQQLLRGFDRVAAVSDEVKGKIPGGSAAKGRVQVIRNGISLEPYDRIQAERTRKRLIRRSEGRAVVGYVGRLSDDKGAGLLLEAGRDVLRQFPGTSLLLVGDGTQRNVYEIEFRSPDVFFAGFQREVQRCYSCMDIFVLPSYAEGLPMTILEAMASRLPVIATRVGQVPELVEDGQTGVLVNPGDKVQLAEAICRLIENPEESAKMGERGYARVAARYSAERMADAYLRLYQEAAGAVHVRPAEIVLPSGCSPGVSEELKR